MFLIEGHKFQVEINNQQWSLSGDKSLTQNTTEEWEIIVFQVRSGRGHSYVMLLWRNGGQEKTEGQDEHASSESITWGAPPATLPPSMSLWNNQWCALELFWKSTGFGLTWIIRKGSRLEQNISTHGTLTSTKAGPPNHVNQLLCFLLIVWCR